MSTKRYQVLVSPFVGFNGKLDQSSVKCKNLENSSKSGTEFYYGNNRDGKNIAYFAMRKRSRNLTSSPYSTAEQNIKTYFTNSQTCFTQQIYDSSTSTQKTYYSDARRLFLASGAVNFRAWCVGQCVKSAKESSGSNYLTWVGGTWSPS